MAPEFELATDGEGKVALSDLRGKRVVLFFYPKDDTSGCTKEACSFRDRISEFEEQEVVVLGISPDDVKSHDKFVNKYDLNFPLLSDPGHAVADAYGTWGKKKMYGREYEGIHRTTFLIGADGRLEKVFRKVKPAESAAEVLAEIHR